MHKHRNSFTFLRYLLPAGESVSDDISRRFLVHSNFFLITTVGLFSLFQNTSYFVTEWHSIQHNQDIRNLFSGSGLAPLPHFIWREWETIFCRLTFKNKIPVSFKQLHVFLRLSTPCVRNKSELMSICLCRSRSNGLLCDAAYAHTNNLDPCIHH